MSTYLVCICVLAGLLGTVLVLFVLLLILKREKNEKNIIEQLRQKKSTLYIKLDVKSKDFVINNKHTYLNLSISKHIADLCKSDDFIENMKIISKSLDVYEDNFKIGDEKIYLKFFYRDKIDNYTILRCDYSVEKVVEPIVLKTIDDIKLIHDKSNNKAAALYYLNIKDFNAVNQRYGQKCGDYILEVIKHRLTKIEKSNLHSCYLGADQFGVYCNKKSINKKRAMSQIKDIYKKITKPVDVGYINLELSFGVGVSVGEYGEFDRFVKESYVASDYARKRKRYSIVIYNDTMRLENDMIESSEKELTQILTTKDVNINYNPVFFYNKGKFVGYFSSPIFSNSSVNYGTLKDLAVQKEKEEQLLSTIIDNQLINYLKKRPKKSSKLFINLTLEDLPIFLEIYLSNSAYSDCKIVICLNVKKGYEMLNKFPHISSTINKIIEEGIEFALEINYSNMYNYDYMLKNATYLILDDSIVSNMNITMIKNKFLNVIELAKTYDLELFAIDVNEYIQFENLLKYNVNYFSGSYFGKGAKKPNDIEQTRTKIFAKFIKDSKKNKEN